MRFAWWFVFVDMLQKKLDTMWFSMDLNKPTHLTLGETLLLATGVLILISAVVITTTGSFQLWRVAKWLYATGIMILIFYQ